MYEAILFNNTSLTLNYDFVLTNCCFMPSKYFKLLYQAFTTIKLRFDCTSCSNILNTHYSTVTYCYSATQFVYSCFQWTFFCFEIMLSYYIPLYFVEKVDMWHNFRQQAFKSYYLSNFEGLMIVMSYYYYCY